MSINTLPLPTANVQPNDLGHISDHHAIANFLQALAQEGAAGSAASYMPYNVRTYGAVGDGAADDTAAIRAAFQAAENNGGRKIIYFPTGTYKIVGTLALSGFSSVIRGDGCQNSGSLAGGTTIKASAQTGPVLDFTGYRWPDYGGRAIFSGFNVVGDGTANTLGAKTGLLLPGAINATFTDITISACGSSPLSIQGANYCDFSRLLITNPVGAGSNDVAWILAASIVGCRFSTILLHSLLSSGDVGPSGAIRQLEAGSGVVSAGNTFTDLMFDTMHVPTNAAIFAHRGNADVLSNFTFSGCQKATGATGTAFVRLAKPPTDTGGNTFTGLIPGDAGGATDLDTGIDVVQSGNRIVGVKGAVGANVTLESGVTNTTVVLEGNVAGATGPGVVDNSGGTANNYADNFTGAKQLGPYQFTAIPRTPNGAGVQVSDSSNPQVGALYLGSQGAAVQNGSAATKDLYFTGAHHTFRDPTKAIIPLLLSTVATDPAALLTANSGTTPAQRLAGLLDFLTDNTWDIGGATANRPRDLNLGRNAVVGGNLTVDGAATVDGALSVASLLVAGAALPIVTAGFVGGVSTSVNGRYTWPNPIGRIPAATVLMGSSAGTINSTYIPTLIGVNADNITVYFTTGAGAQATSATGVAFRFILIG